MKCFYKFYLVALLISLVAAGIVCGKAYHSFITPKSSQGEFHRINGDAWLVDGSYMTYADLFERGNQLKLTFSEWHPDGKPTPHLKAYVCEKLASEFEASAGSTQVIYLTGSCEPRKVKFEVLNPFVASEKDNRRLGVQLKSAEITSKLGFPIVKMSLILKTAGALFILTLLAGHILNSCCTSRFVRFLPLLIPFCAYPFFSIATLNRPDKLIALGLFLLVLLIGLSQKRHNDASEDALCPYRALLLLVICMAACIRFYAITFGLPANFHPDEVPKFNVVMGMYVHGTLDPNYFLHPTLLLYAMYFTNVVVHGLLSLLGMAGEWQNTLLFSGRLVSATAGVLSVLFVYIIGKRLFSQKTGLIAAFFLAFSPLHVTCSRYVKEDALLTCLILASVVVLLKAVYEDKKYLTLAAGILAGCSAGVKYSGILTLCVILATPWLKSRSFKPDKSWFLVTFLAVLCVPLGFLICTPYSILNYTRFAHDFRQEKQHMQKGHFVFIDAWSYFWLYHFKRSIIPALTFPVALCGIAGIGVLLRRFKINGLFLIALILLYYLPAEYVKAKPAPQPERYILPCLPFLAISAAEAIQAFSARRKQILAFLFVVLMVFPAYRTFSLASDLEPDTRDKMRIWMQNNIPHGSLVAVDWKYYAFPFVDDPHVSIFYLDRETIIEQFDAKNLRNTHADYLLLSSLFYDRYFSQQEASGAIREKIRHLFKTYPIVHEEEAQSGTYGFHNPKLTLLSLKSLKE